MLESSNFIAHSLNSFDIHKLELNYLSKVIKQNRPIQSDFIEIRIIENLFL